MLDENDRQYVRATEIPEWMASTLGKIIPVALVSALATCLLVWRDIGLMDSRLERLEQFASVGERFSRADGNGHADRIAKLEKYRDDHTAFAYETLARWQQKLSDIEWRLRQVEKVRGEP